MNKLLIGTTNKGKLKEIKSILKGKRIKIISLREIKNPSGVYPAPHAGATSERDNRIRGRLTAIHPSDITSGGFMWCGVKETGKTYKSNALKKAKTLARITGMPVLAEDSGLEVKALGNKPGIYSARYSKEATPEKNNQKLLKELEGVPLPRRNALYRCVAVFIKPTTNNKQLTTKLVAEGICKGRIALALKGRKGFGYDPLFIPEGYRKTFGELPQSIKNRISHRTKAIKKLMKMI